MGEVELEVNLFGVWALLRQRFDVLVAVKTQPWEGVAAFAIMGHIADDKGVLDMLVSTWTPLADEAFADDLGGFEGGISASLAVVCRGRRVTSRAATQRSIARAWS